MKKRTILAFIMLTALISPIFAQTKKFSLSAGPTFFSPLNTRHKSLYKNGISGSINGSYQVTKLGSIITGLTVLTNNDKFNNEDYNVYFLKTGYRTNLTNTNIFLFADAGLGGYITKNKTTYSFVGGMGLGYSINIAKQHHIDISANPNLLLPSNGNAFWLLLNVNYRFTFK